jgi:hypothetical protein
MSLLCCDARLTPRFRLTASPANESVLASSARAWSNGEMRVSLASSLALVLALTLASPALAAEDDAYGDPSAEPAPPPPAQAVKPEPKSKAPVRRGKRARKPEPPANAPVATYPGFRMMTNGASFVWLEVSRRVDVTETKSPTRLVYRLKGAITRSRNNLRPLITDYFRSPVGRVQLVESGDDLDLVIDLRASGDGKVRIVPSEGGITLRIDFPKMAREPDGAAPPAKTPATRPAETRRIVDEQP